MCVHVKVMSAVLYIVVVPICGKYSYTVLVDIVTSWFCDILHWMDVGQLLLYLTRPQLRCCISTLSVACGLSKILNFAQL